MHSVLRTEKDIKEERFTYHADCYFSFAGYGWIRTITEHNIRIYHSTRLRGKFQFARSIKEKKSEYLIMAEVLKQTASAFVLDLLIIGQQKITFRNITLRTLISWVIFNLYDK